MKKIFVTGISTEVGKTVVAAILTEALQADYWKPIQAGDLENSDAHKVQRLISNTTSVIHPNSYALQTPMSPHGAAEIDGLKISLAKIKEPTTEHDLVIEGAGGLLVPLNNKDTIADLIQPDYEVVIVSRHYLGSINHTLLTVEALKKHAVNIKGIIFSGAEHPSTESIIQKMTQVPILGRVDEEPYFDQNVVKEYAEKLRDVL